MIIGKKILRYSTIDSTNDEARRLIKQGGGEGLVVVADRQTGGKGKPGSTWFSPPGNLYFSAVVKPFKSPKDLASITLLGALAARSMIIRLSGQPVTIKWPNDLRVHGKKIGGILTERLSSGYLIIGIGVNVNCVPKELRRQSASMKSATGKTFPLKKCSAALQSELDKEYLAYLAKV